jgi:hypothetical protein
MKRELIFKNGWVEMVLLDDRYLACSLYICEKSGPRGDVKVFDLKKGIELSITE